ncbi:MAG: ATP-binding cassette domain-containing protein [Candidatus Wallbacteria bacterium]|nr:ATP-binding cassette domain-containing protein [Candidatus Wallbacteria bacterium]
MELIKVSNLTKYYGDVQAVSNAGFSVNKGEIVGLLGPNGAGKTTIMKIITGYLAATSGSAEVGGLDVAEHPLKVKSMIGYLPENSPLYHDMTVFEYLSFIAEIRGLYKKESKRAIEEKVRVCGLEPMLHRSISALSKGFRQRVGLASVLLHDPEILILDEPTSGLDPRQIIEIRQLIREIGCEKTVILSTHILAEVEVTCSRVIIINNGRIAAQGQTSDIAGSLSGNEVISAVFRAPKEELEQKLAGAIIAHRIECTSLDDGLVRLKIETEKKPRLTEEIFHFAVSNGYTLSELKKEGLSLEEVFIQLTAGEGHQ